MTNLNQPSAICSKSFKSNRWNSAQRACFYCLFCLHRDIPSRFSTTLMVCLEYTTISSKVLESLTIHCHVNKMLEIQRTNVRYEDTNKALRKLIS